MICNAAKRAGFLFRTAPNLSTTTEGRGPVPLHCLCHWRIEIHIWMGFPFSADTVASCHSFRHHLLILLCDSDVMPRCVKLSDGRASALSGVIHSVTYCRPWQPKPQPFIRMGQEARPPSTLPRALVSLLIFQDESNLSPGQMLSPLLVYCTPCHATTGLGKWSVGEFLSHTTFNVSSAWTEALRLLTSNLAGI